MRASPIKRAEARATPPSPRTPRPSRSLIARLEDAVEREFARAETALEKRQAEDHRAERARAREPGAQPRRIEAHDSRRAARRRGGGQWRRSDRRRASPPNWPSSARSLLAASSASAARGGCDELHRRILRARARAAARRLGVLRARGSMAAVARAGRRAWRVWLMLGGRGAGKTRAGAEWVTRGRARPPAIRDAPAVGRIALVGETAADVREVMIEGVSGLLAVHPRSERPRWEPSRRRLTCRQRRRRAGVLRRGSREPARPAIRRRLVRRARQMAPCRGDLGHAAIRACGSATGRARSSPRRRARCRSAEAAARRPGVAVTRATTRANAANLAPAFLETRRRAICRHAAGPAGARRRDRRGARRRAVDARHAGALRASPRRRRWRASSSPSIRRRPRGKRADAAASSRPGSTQTASSTCWPTRRSQRRARRNGRARRVALYRRLEADALVAEVNQGGEMVRAVHARGRSERAGDGGARDARQISARRAGGAALRAGPRAPCRRLSGAGGRDVRFRRPTARRPAAAPTGSTRWSGRSRAGAGARASEPRMRRLS